MTPTAPDAMPHIHPPYAWFGGKRKVGPLVWEALGDVAHYIEPFFGGGSVFLMRPHAPRLETINDYDGFVCNFWRAVQADPTAVADGLDWPVNEIDLEARHLALCRQPDKTAFLERMKHDPEYYDIQRAAWFCWGLNAWIGSGWCGGEYYPDATEQSHGVPRQLPRLGCPGVGTHKISASLHSWMEALCNRLRRTRVCCGDWARICTDGATAHRSTVGVFLDPPYSAEAGRNETLYRCEDLTIAHRVRDWCLARTDQPRYRIVLCGYEGEHEELEAHGWRVQAWKANGGFANFAKGDVGRINAGRERIWFSPSCLNSHEPLFTQGAEA